IWKSAVSVRVEPGTKAKRVTTVSLGERFEYLGESQVIETEENDQKWAKIKLLDGNEGWILEDFILVGGQPAAILREQTPVYRRPDILTKSDKDFGKFDVIGVKGEGAFVEFKGMRSDDTWFTSGWIKSENIKINPVDVATAVYITKALKLEDDGEQLKELKSIYNSGDFEGSYFLTDLEDMIRKMD
ncbi:MAG: SH3 domain-containing protein, partial [Bacteroidota bacterium]